MISSRFTSTWEKTIHDGILDGTKNSNLAPNKNVNIVSGPCMGRCQYAPIVCVGKNYIDNANVEKVLIAIEKKEYKPKIKKYINYKDYKLEGGYSILSKINNNELTFEKIKKTLEKSNLRGKGGAGFPTFKKWEFVLSNPEPRYLTINADEGEVGTFKDRYYLELDPHRFF